MEHGTICDRLRRWCPHVGWRSGSRKALLILSAGTHMIGAVHRSKIILFRSAQGQKPALPRRSIDVRFALNKQTPTERVQCDAIVPISDILHRRKIASLFRRQTTVKSVTDLPIGAWYRFGDCSRHDPIRDRKTFDAISPDIRPPSGHFPADSAPPVISSQVTSARSTTGRTSWFKRYRCCTSFAAASVTRA